MKSLKLRLAGGILLGLVFTMIFGGSSLVFADAGITMSPLNEQIKLMPGDIYRGSFFISNQAKNTEDVEFRISVEPFYVDENYDIHYETNGDFNQIVDWIEVSEDGGIIAPNNKIEVHYSVNVPIDAPAGGQYVAIKATSINRGKNDSEGLAINVEYGVAHIIYAEVAGTTERNGKIETVDIPGFLLSGNVSGNSVVKNIGNVHGISKYTLQVFPLFSNEEIYTNEEDPDTKVILPDRSLYHEIVWDKTPDIGIFNVVYKVEFEGKTAEVKKMVIKCPIWLLFIIIFVVFALIFYFVARVRARKKTAKKQ